MIVREGYVIGDGEKGREEEDILLAWLLVVVVVVVVVVAGWPRASSC